MSESKIQAGIMDLLLVHKDIAWAMVVTTGTVKGLRGGHPIKVGHYMSDDQKRKTGMSDIIGQLRDGRFFSIETKKPGEKPSKEQFDFMELVNKNGGLSFWCDSVESAAYGLSEGVI